MESPMQPLHRLSMNTSLKNARIFDDDAWNDDDQEPKKKIKQEPKEPLEAFAATQMTSNILKKEVKQEPSDSDDTFEEEEEDDTFEECSGKKYIKKEVVHHNKSLEEGELENSHYSLKLETINENSSEEENKPFRQVKTPPLLKIKSDPDAPVDRMFDDSPYNKEMFKSLKIKEETPIKNENDEADVSFSRNATLKSAKRTVFNRHSPYKKSDSDTVDKRMAIKSRLGPKIDEVDEDPSKKKKYTKHDLESDPAVIARREKQIEYGKNTIGYENYVKMVPRSDRKTEDPQTPPKFQKYSRRGWEGLIKQWRIKLHRYDPPEEEEKAS